MTLPLPAHSKLPWKQDLRDITDADGNDIATTDSAPWKIGVANAAFIVRAANSLETSVAALKEAERFMAYFAGKTDGLFIGLGTPASCLAQIRTALSLAQGEGA